MRNDLRAELTGEHCYLAQLPQRGCRRQPARFYIYIVRAIVTTLQLFNCSFKRFADPILERFSGIQDGAIREIDDQGVRHCLSHPPCRERKSAGMYR